MRTGNADYVVTKIFYEAFEVHRDEGLVFDDQNIGRDLCGHLAAGRIGQRSDFADIRIEDEGHFFFRKAFKRQQQEALARQRRDIRKPTLGRHRQRHDVIIVVDRNRIPDLREQTKQTGTRTMLFV